MKKLFLFALVIPLFGQQTTPLATQQPDCRIFFYLTGASTGAQAALTPVNGTAGVSAVIDNRQVACDGWTLTYSSFGFSAVSLLFQSAPNGSAALPSATGVPGTWAAFAGTTVSGSNPSTSTTQTELTATGYFPFVRVNLTAKTGTGIIIGELHGFKTNSSPGSGGGGGGGCTSPCTVIGPDAAGVTPTQNAVEVSGVDGGGLVRRILTDTAGRVVINGQTANGGASAGNPVIVAGVDPSNNVRRLQTDVNGVLATVDTLAGADGNSNGAGGAALSNTGGDRFLQVYPYRFNGSTWDRDFVCPLQGTFGSSASGNQQIIALSGTTVIRICSIDFSTTAPENVLITRGTGSNCGTGTATIKSMTSAVNFDFEPGPLAAIRGTAGSAICINPAAAQAFTVNFTYAQF